MSDRPLFDDNDLPDWLTGGTASSGGDEFSSLLGGDSPAGSSSTPTDEPPELDWLNSFGKDDPVNPPVTPTTPQPSNPQSKKRTTESLLPKQNPQSSLGSMLNRSTESGGTPVKKTSTNPIISQPQDEFSADLFASDTPGISPKSNPSSSRPPQSNAMSNDSNDFDASDISSLEDFFGFSGVVTGDEAEQPTSFDPSFSDSFGSSSGASFMDQGMTLGDSPENADDEVPDWFASAKDQGDSSGSLPTPSDVPSQTPSTGGMLSAARLGGMASLGASAGATAKKSENQPALPTPDPTPDDDIPDWMKEVPTFGSSESFSEAASGGNFTSTASTDIPNFDDMDTGLDWLQQLPDEVPNQALPTPVQPPPPSSAEANKASSSGKSNVKKVGSKGQSGGSPAKDDSGVGSFDIDALLSLAPTNPSLELPPEPTISVADVGGFDFGETLPVDPSLDAPEDLTGLMAGFSESLAPRPSRPSGMQMAADNADRLSKPSQSNQVTPNFEAMSLEEAFGELPPTEDSPEGAVAGGYSDFDLNAIFPNADVEGFKRDAEDAAKNPLDTGLMPRLPSPDSAMRDLSQSDTVPEWVADMRPTDAPVSLSVGDQVVKVKEQPLSQMPDQMRQLRDRARQMSGAASQQPQVVAEDGVLAGITGAIGAAAQAAVPAPAIFTPPSKDYALRVKLLQSIINADPELKIAGGISSTTDNAVASAKATKNARIPIKIDRVLISVLLLVLILAPYFTSILNITPKPVPDANNAARIGIMGNAINGLTRGQPVLIAFEYAPTASVELDSWASVLLAELFKQGVRPVVISTNPAGAIHAYAFLNKLSPNATNPYTILRYLSGGAIGIRTLVEALYGADRLGIFQTDLNGKPAGLSAADVVALRNAPVFVLSETPDAVRDWAEQFKSPESTDQLTMIFLTAVSASSTARAYVGVPTSTGSAPTNARFLTALSSLNEIELYRQVRGLPVPGNEAIRNDQRAQSIGVGTLGATLIILFGTAVNGVRNIVRGRSSNRRRRLK